MTSAGSAEGSDLATPPLVSAIMPCYRQERFVRDALLSVMAQDYSPLEIIVADDASPDRSLAMIEEAVAGYQGPHEIKILGADKNRGIENYLRLYDAARGELLVECHGDDLAYPGRVSRLVAAWRGSDASLMTSNAMIMDADGRRKDLFFTAQASYATDALDIVRDGWRPWLLGATYAYPRDLITTFAPLSRMRSPIENDWILPFRASLMRGIHVVDESLLDYRVHDASASAAAGARAEQDTLVRFEATAAQRLGQFLYMLETMGTAPATTLAGSRREKIHWALVASILKTAFAWSNHRHALRGFGLNPHWLAPN